MSGRPGPPGQRPSTEAGVLYVMGVSQATLARISREPTLPIAISLSQQMCALLLRGLGVPLGEAEAVAAQAADEIVREGRYSQGSEG